MTHAAVLKILIALAAGSQVWALWYMYRRWPTVPRRLFFLTPGGYRYWGSRWEIWFSPVLMLGAIVIIAMEPRTWTEPHMEIPFVLIIAFGLILGFRTDEYINYARRHKEPADGNDG